MSSPDAARSARSSKFGPGMRSRLLRRRRHAALEDRDDEEREAKHEGNNADSWKPADFLDRAVETAAARHRIKEDGKTDTNSHQDDTAAKRVRGAVIRDRVVDQKLWRDRMPFSASVRSVLLRLCSERKRKKMLTIAMAAMTIQKVLGWPYVIYSVPPIDRSFKAPERAKTPASVSAPMANQNKAFIISHIAASSTFPDRRCRSGRVWMQATGFYSAGVRPNQVDFFFFFTVFLRGAAAEAAAFAFAARSAASRTARATRLGLPSGIMGMGRFLARVGLNRPQTRVNPWKCGATQRSES